MIQAKIYVKVILMMVTASLFSSNVVADKYRLSLQPELVLPEIAIESTYPGFKNKKHAVLNGKRLANSLSFNSESGTRIGVLRYRNEQGKSRYGVGYRYNFSGNNVDTLINGKGLLFATEQNNLLLNLHIKSHEPENDDDSTYVQFSLMGNW